MVKPDTALLPDTAPMLRKASLGDALLLADMHARSWAATYRSIFSAAYLDGGMAAERRAHWQQHMPEMLEGSGDAYIAQHNGKAVGFLCVMAPDQHGSVLVDHLHAMPESKGMGLGTAMLEHARQWALDKGAKRMHLRVLEQNTAAIGFYASRGWRLLERRDDRLGGQDIVALVYGRSLEV